MSDLKFYDVLNAGYQARSGKEGKKKQNTHLINKVMYMTISCRMIENKFGIIHPIRNFFIM